MNKLSGNGRLAQLVAHPLDVREVTSSSLVSSTTISSPFGEDIFYFPVKTAFFRLILLCFVDTGFWFPIYVNFLRN